MTRKRIPWKQYFMMQALVIAQRSTCDRALVGSVLSRKSGSLALATTGQFPARTTAMTWATSWSMATACGRFTLK